MEIEKICPTFYLEDITLTHSIVLSADQMRKMPKIGDSRQVADRTKRLVVSREYLYIPMKCLARRY